MASRCSINPSALSTPFDLPSVEVGNSYKARRLFTEVNGAVPLIAFDASVSSGPRAAIIFYEECLKINPQNSQALNNIAPAYYSIKEYKKAEDAIRLSIKLSPKPKYQHMFLSSLLLQDQRLTEGWKEYKWSHYGNNFNLTVKSNNIPYWNGECLKGKKYLFVANKV